MLTVKVWAFDTGMLSQSSDIYKTASWLRNGLKYGFRTNDYDAAADVWYFESSLIYSRVFSVPQTR